jgi:hypothetical protein
MCYVYNRMIEYVCVVLAVSCRMLYTVLLLISFSVPRANMGGGGYVISLQIKLGMI